MKLRTIIYYLLIAFGIIFISSCAKENIETATIDPEDFTPEVVECELTIDISETAGWTLTANVLNGMEPYTYLWSNDASTASITVNDLETYSVTVTDAEGCSMVQTSAVSGDPCSSFAGGTQLIQFVNDMLVAVATGGTAPYTYLWHDGTTSNSIPIVDDYILTITDAEGCTIVVEVGDINNPCSSFTGGFQLVNDMLTAYATGGVEPYSYAWNNGETTNTLQNGSLDETYNVTITDAVDCTTIMPITIGSCSENFTVEIGLANYNDSLYTIYLWPHFGVEPYEYEWLNGETTSTITVNEPGTYVVIISDQNGCISEHEIETL